MLSTVKYFGNPSASASLPGGMSIFAVAKKILELPPDRADAFAEFVSPLNAVFERVKPKVPTKEELCQRLLDLNITAPYPRCTA